MVSEPNFVLGIKQTSLANKEDSHVHTAIRSHTCLSAGSRLHSISQLPWLTAVSRSSSPSNPCLSLSNLCTTSLLLMKPTRQTWSMAYRDQNPGTRPPMASTRATMHEQRLLDSHTRRRRFSTPKQDRSHTRRLYGLVVHRSTWLENLVVIRRRTRLHVPLGFLESTSRAGGLSTRLPRAEICCWCHLTSPDDVITPRQQPRKHVHVSPSPRQRHVIWWCHRLYCSTRDPTRKPGTDSDQYPLTLTLDQLTLTLTFCVELWPKVKISDRAYFAQFFA